jgi:hypothetical protein
MNDGIKQNLGYGTRARFWVTGGGFFMLGMGSVGFPKPADLGRQPDAP